MPNYPYILSKRSEVLALIREWLVICRPSSRLGSQLLRADRIIVGLGNPGNRYAYTRHNAGILAVSKMAATCGARTFRPVGKAMVTTVELNGNIVLLALPRVPMNINGQVVADLMARTGCQLEHILIVHDDEHLPASVVRVSGKGDTKGHRGLASVATAVGAGCFVRGRIGIGQRPARGDLSHLLDPLHGSERDNLLAGAAKGAAAAITWGMEGLTVAQNRFNQHRLTLNWQSSSEISCHGNEKCRAPFLPPLPSVLAVTLFRRVGAVLYQWLRMLLFFLARIYRSTLGRRTRLTVVIGTYGKTTTCRTISAVLGVSRHSPMQINGVNSGLRLAAMALMLRPSCTHGILEVGISKPGAMEGYGRTLRPDLVVWTCIGSEHHNSFLNNWKKRDEKALMLNWLRPGGTLVANGDDPLVQEATERCQERVIRYGLMHVNDVRASNIRLDFPHGTHFMLHAIGHSPRKVFVPLLGTVNVRAALAAVAVALAEGVDLDIVLARLAYCKPGPKRLEPVQTSGGTWLLNDIIKSHEETIYAALELLEQITNMRRTLILGDIEEPLESSHRLHTKLGVRIAGSVDRLICVGQNYRSLSAGALKAGMLPENIINSSGSLRIALNLLMTELGSRDVVLIKGRGKDGLDRIRLAFQGQEVHCTALPCPLKRRSCHRCDRLRGVPTTIANPITPRGQAL